MLDDDPAISSAAERPRAVGNANSWQAARIRRTARRSPRAAPPAAPRPRRREHRRHRLPRARPRRRSSRGTSRTPRAPQRLRLWLLRPRLGRVAGPAERHRLDRERPPVGRLGVRRWWSDARHSRATSSWHPSRAWFAIAAARPRPRRPRHGHRAASAAPGKALPAGASTSPVGDARARPARQRTRPRSASRGQVHSAAQGWIAATTPRRCVTSEGIRATPAAPPPFRAVPPPQAHGAVRSPGLPCSLPMHALAPLLCPLMLPRHGLRRQGAQPGGSPSPGADNPARRGNAAASPRARRGHYGHAGRPDRRLIPIESRTPDGKIAALPRGQRAGGANPPPPASPGGAAPARSPAAPTVQLGPRAQPARCRCCAPGGRRCDCLPGYVQQADGSCAALASRCSGEEGMASSKSFTTCCQVSRPSRAWRASTARA